MNTKKIIITLVFILGFLSSTFSQEPKYLSLQESFVANEKLTNAGIGIYAINLNTNEILLDYNSATSFTPASILKLHTTAMALEQMGTGAHFKTSIAYDGAIEDSILNGNIYIIGGGDPCLGTERYSEIYGEDITATWASQIRDLGIKEINGDIISDISYFGEVPTPGKWVWEDLGAYYGSQGSSLNYMDNTYQLFFDTGNHKDTAILTKVIPNDLRLIVRNEVIASEKVYNDNSIIYRGKSENEIIINGALPCNKKDYVVEGCIPNPPLYVAERLWLRLNYLQIPVSGEAKVEFQKRETDERITISTISSPSLLSIVNYTNRVSCNLYAEMLRLHIMRRSGQSFEKYGVAFMKKRGIDSNGFYPVDGSGVSHFDAITAKQTTQLLKHIYNSKYGSSFINGLAEAGKSGTLKSYKCSKDGLMRLQAKTGSMTRVRSLAGYITNTKKEKIAFSIILNNYDGNSSELRTILDNFVRQIGMGN